MKPAIEPKRVIEPIALGAAANVLATYMLKPVNPQFDWVDFVVACTLMIPVTEFNRYLDRSLEQRYTWAQQPFKRVLLHFIYLALTLILLLNALGNLYLAISGQSFFTWRELLLINGATFVVAILLVFLNWMLHFYNQWRSTSLALQDSSQKIRSLQQDMARGNQVVEFQKGQQKLQVEPGTIRLVTIEGGVVRAWLENGQSTLYPGTLRELAALLPEYLFFSATRDVIIHREVIQSMSSSSYGKIEVVIKNSTGTEHITISRLKAAAFRKWYYSSSTTNS
jgi:hypothetical protein